jgi:hypothetical protein
MSAWGKLHAATLELSKGTALKQRLTATYSNHLTQLEASELPSSLRGDWRSLLDAFEAVPPLRGETAVQSTVRKMSLEEAERLAAQVVTLFGQVSRLCAPRAVEEPSRLAGDGEPGSRDRAEVLPLFAAEA